MIRAALYKGTHAGIPGIYNRGVRALTRGPYSHVELVFNGGIAASASFMDKGVRFKQIVFDPTLWDFIELPDYLELNARSWFVKHQGDGYDIWGNVHFVVPTVSDDKDKWFCSEAIAAALGIPDPWRFDPNTLAQVLPIFNKPASAGFFTPNKD